VLLEDEAGIEERVADIESREVGKVTRAQSRRCGNHKCQDLNATDLEGAIT